jgi:hypothetical protein
MTREDWSAVKESDVLAGATNGVILPHGRAFSMIMRRL